VITAPTWSKQSAIFCSVAGLSGPAIAFEAFEEHLRRSLGERLRALRPGDRFPIKIFSFGVGGVPSKLTGMPWVIESTFQPKRANQRKNITKICINAFQLP